MLVDFLVEFFFVNFLPRDVNAVGYSIVIVSF